MAHSRRDRPTVLIIGPVPPPEFGVAKATKLMLESKTLAADFDIIHLDTSDVQGFASMGSLGWNNISLGIKHVSRLIWLQLRLRPEVTLLTVSAGKFALIRDWLFVFVARLFHSQVIAYLRGSKYADLRSREGQLAARITRSILKHSARTIVLGRSLAPMAQTVYRHARVEVVPNGCPPASAHGRDYSRDQQRPMALFMSRLSRAKGVTDLMSTARRVTDEVPELDLVLCGGWDSPQYEEEVVSIVQEQGLSNNIRFPGPVSGETKDELLARASVLVVPSHSEGHPWVILEAMSAAIPVVASDTGAIAETIRDGVAGFVVPVGDTDMFAQRLCSLLQDDDLWRQMSQNAVQRYRDEFTEERSHSALAKVLVRVVQEG